MSHAAGQNICRHPDLFSAEEAAVYLHLPPDQKTTIENYRERGDLPAAKIGKAYFYHRRDLDALVLKIFSFDDKPADIAPPAKPLREANGAKFREQIRTAETAQPAKGPKLKFNGVAVGERA